MQVREGMSEVVLTLGPDHTLREAAALMSTKGIGAALVATTRARFPASSPSATSCSRWAPARTPTPSWSATHMSDAVIAASPDWSLERAAAEMSRRGIRHLVVYDGSELVGVLSMRDIVRVWTSDGRDLRDDTPQ